jgi:hypothetical protein
MFLGDNQIYLDEIPELGAPTIKINLNEKWIKHVHCEGMRFHVLRWSGYGNGFGRRCIAITRCSEPDCIVNKIADEQIEEYNKNPFEKFQL